jgi:hypothetical protein
MRFKALAGLAALSLLGGQAFALDASDATPAGSQAAEDAGAKSARSMECLHKADAQNLRGKERKHFLLDCKHGV